MLEKEELRQSLTRQAEEHQAQMAEKEDEIVQIKARNEKECADLAASIEAMKRQLETAMQQKTLSANSEQSVVRDLNV